MKFYFRGWSSPYYANYYVIRGNFEAGNEWKEDKIIEYDHERNMFYFEIKKPELNYTYQFKFKSKYYDNWFVKDCFPHIVDSSGHENNIVCVYSTDDISVEALPEDTVLNCKICLEKRIHSVFLCGHGTCSSCFSKLKNVCPFCKNSIDKRIKLFI